MHKWDPEKIVKTDVNPRSYIIQNCIGNVITRNRLDLRSSKNAYQMLSFDHDDKPQNVNRDKAHDFLSHYDVNSNIQETTNKKNVTEMETDCDPKHINKQEQSISTNASSSRNYNIKQKRSYKCS